MLLDNPFQSDALVEKEAISFGIPILACNVGGVEEIVIPRKTEFLMPVDTAPENVSFMINQALVDNFNSREIHKLFAKNLMPKRIFVRATCFASNQDKNLLK